MKTFWIFMVGCLLPVAAFGELQWLTSLPEALRKAQAEHKAVLVDFTGSDWCGWCIRLKREVFDQPEFARFAQPNLLLVEVDFPQQKPQSLELRVANQKLAEEFGIKGYPSIFILDAQGKRLEKTGYVPGGVKNYIQMLSEIPGHNWKPSADAQSNPAGPPSSANPASAKPAEPAKLSPPAASAGLSGNLALKGISKGRRLTLAVINDQNMAAGETSVFKLWDARENKRQEVKVTCKEIREASVIVQIEGEKEPQELKLVEKN